MACNFEAQVRQEVAKDSRHRKQDYENLDKKMMTKMTDGFKNEENGRQLVENELAIMKDELKNLKMGSGSTVRGEAITRMGLGSSTFARQPTPSSRWT